MTDHLTVDPYYNDNDAHAVSWIRSLQGASLIPHGKIDERSIADIRPSDIAGFTECHFFAGIGGWAYALRLAGWPRGREIWTGSCPCQPFSAAGSRRGIEDERHLWPAFRWLIAQRRPATIVGEQVSSSDGREWLAGVFDDLEAMGYVCAGTDLPACCVSAPHKRNRLFWVADAASGNTSAEWIQRSGKHGQRQENGGVGGGLGDTELQRTRQGNGQVTPKNLRREGVSTQRSDTNASGSDGGLDDTQSIDTRHDGGRCTESGGGRKIAGVRRSQTQGFWQYADYLYCSDDKWRPVEPGTFPLAHGIPKRVAQLRGLGNAIVPQVAAEFLKAVLELQCPSA